VTRLLLVLLAGAVAAGVWLPLLVTLDPTTLTLSVPYVVLGLVGTAATAVWLGAWTARHTDEGLGGASLAGAAVGATAWAFGLAPTLAAVSQAPVLLPVAFAPDAQAVLITALSLSVARATVWLMVAPGLFVVAGGLLGALGGWDTRRSGERFCAPAPGPLGMWAAVWTLGFVPPMQAAFQVAIPTLTSSTAWAGSQGQQLVANPLVGWQVALGQLVLALPAAGALIAVILGLRQRTRLGAWPRLLALLGPLYALGVVGFLATTGALALTHLLMVVLPLLTGAGLVAVGLPLRASGAPDAYSLPRTLQLSAVLALSWGLGEIQLGLVSALGAVGRIIVLTRHGAGAPGNPEFVTEITDQIYGTSALLFGAVWTNLTTPTLIWIVGRWIADGVRRRRAG